MHSYTEGGLLHTHKWKELLFSSPSPEEPIPALFDKPRIPGVPEKGLYYIVTIVARIGLSSIENTPYLILKSHSFLILSRGCWKRSLVSWGLNYRIGCFWNPRHWAFWDSKHCSISSFNCFWFPFEEGDEDGDLCQNPRVALRFDGIVEIFRWGTQKTNLMLGR